MRKSAAAVLSQGTFKNDRLQTGSSSESGSREYFTDVTVALPTSALCTPQLAEPPKLTWQVHNKRRAASEVGYPTCKPPLHLQVPPTE